MRINKKILFAGVLSLCFGLLPGAARAHELIRDTTGKTGAILHISPDDDPIAGKQSTLFFDIQGEPLQTATFSIQKGTGRQATAPVTIDGNAASVQYTFSAQGTYKLVLRASSATQTYEFHYSQLVSSGAAAASADHTSVAWAKPVLAASICAFIGLAIAAVVRRKAIAERSHFKK